MIKECENCGGNRRECRCRRVKEIQELIRLKREEFSSKIRGQLEEKLRELRGEEAKKADD